MQIPPTPDDEETRIDSLRALDVLDTSPEERFDRLTRLTKRLFDVPICLVSLIDVNRQWFKSCYGLEVTETPRDISFCGHAILQDDVFVIPDASLDDRFRDNPLVTGDPHIRFYAGCPVTVANGSKLGTLCIIDRTPREFGSEDRQLLRDLTRLAEHEFTGLQDATTDELTLLSNWRGFSLLASHTIKLCARLGRPVSLLCFQLDGLDELNALEGRDAGDRALKTFSQLLLNTFIESDVLGRVSGGEFAALVGQAGGSAFLESLARLEGMVAQHNDAHRDEFQLSYSIGSAVRSPSAPADLNDLFAVAREELYDQKRVGK